MTAHQVERVNRTNSSRFTTCNHLRWQGISFALKPNSPTLDHFLTLASLIVSDKRGMQERLLIAYLLIGASAGFVGNSMKRLPSVLSPPTSPMMSSYEVDSDEDAEQRLGDTTRTPTIPESVFVEEPVSSNSANRYDDVLKAVGLDGKLNHAKTLPSERTISCYDVFCNRELKQEAIKAIGFDMVSVGQFGCDYFVCKCF